MASFLQNFWAAPRFALSPGYKPQCTVRITCLASRDSTLLPSDSVIVNGVYSIEEKEKSSPKVDVTNGHLTSTIKEKSKEDTQNKLEPLWDDGYGTQTVKDYLEIGSEIIKPDGGPPRWFTPISAGPPLEDSPLLLFLPGMDGTGMGLVLHEKALGKVFQVWCLHIPVYDRTPFDELVKFVERTVRMKHDSSPNKPIYLVGDSFGGCLALAVAARNPKIDLVLILANPATSFGRTQFQPLLPLLESLPDEFHVTVPYLLSFVMGDPMKMAMVNIDSTLPPGQIIQRLSDNLTGLLAHLSVSSACIREFVPNNNNNNDNNNIPNGLADIIPKETLLWKLKLLRSASSYSNSRLHAVNAEVLVIASGKDNMLPSGNEAQRLANSLRNCKVRYFKDNGHTILLEDGINLLSIIKGINKYRRSKRHDYVMDFLPPSMSEFKNAVKDNRWYLNFTGPVMLSTMEDGKIVRGLAGVPCEGPLLLVGYHMLMGVEIVPLVEEYLRQRKILLRGIAHPTLFTQLVENRTNESSIIDVLRLYGATPVTASNFFKLLATKSHVLLYPGGAREALHRKGEEYKVIWPEQPEFIRMAAKFGATIVPFGVVGEDDIAQLVLDYDDLQSIPILGDWIRRDNEQAARRGLTVRTDMDGEVANQMLHLPGLLPKIPGRFYYLFGKPIHTKGRQDLVKDREKARELYLQERTTSISMESSRISLRPFKLTDVDDVLLWAGDDRVTRTIRWETLNSKEEALSFIKEVCTPLPWHVLICIDDRSIGFLWVVYPGRGDDRNRADIGYAIAFEYWGQGIATKALKMAVPRVFNDFPGIVKLQAFAVLQNKASHRVLEKAGFHYQGSLTFHGTIKKNVTVVDLVIYSLLSTEICIPPTS